MFSVAPGQPGMVFSAKNGGEILGVVDGGLGAGMGIVWRGRLAAGRMAREICFGCHSAATS